MPAPREPMRLQAAAQRSPIFSITRRGMPGAGASSMIFWWRRCIEQSRSPSQTAFLCWSASTWISMCRGCSRNFSMYTAGLLNAAPASVRVICTALTSAASVCTTRMPRPPPPPAALMMTG